MRNFFFTENTPPEFMDRIKLAKAAVLPDELVQPHRAVPGTPGRILAYGEPPRFASEYAIVNAQTSDEGLIAAMRHVLELETNPKGKTMADWLSEAFGAEVLEVESEHWEPSVSFA